MDPDEYDRMMGITSVDIALKKMGRGDTELTDTKKPNKGSR